MADAVIKAQKLADGITPIGYGLAPYVSTALAFVDTAFLTWHALAWGMGEQGPLPGFGTYWSPHACRR